MNKDLWQYVMQVDPFVKEKDVISIEELNDWDLLITFKSGRKVLYDIYTGYYKNVYYGNINELTEEQERKEFAYRLRSLMGRKWITQEQLAETVGLTQAMISRYVRGEAIPSAIVLRKISKALDCSMDDFFDKNY